MCAFGICVKYMNTFTTQITIQIDGYKLLFASFKQQNDENKTGLNLSCVITMSFESVSVSWKWVLEVIACICVTLNRDFNLELGKINSNKWFKMFKCAYYSMFCLKIIPKPMCCVNGFCKFYSETNVLCKWFFQVLLWNNFVVEMVSECWFALELLLTI